MKRFLCVAAMAILPAAAFGGDLENRTEVTGFGGVIRCCGDETSGIYGGSVGYGTGSRSLVYGEFSYAPLGDYDSLPGVPGSVSVKRSLTDFRFGVKYSLQQSDRFEPYALVAVGIGRIKASTEALGVNVSGSNSEFGVHLGVGGRLYVSPRWGIAPEVVYSRYFGDGGGNTIRATGGIFFQFGQ